MQTGLSLRFGLVVGLWGVGFKGRRSRKALVHSGACVLEEPADPCEHDLKEQIPASESGLRVLRVLRALRVLRV